MSRFYKGHGLGNDYLALDLDALPLELTPPAVRMICDRHRGVGSDGILALVASEVADFGVRIFNPDGSEAEKSGNGLRIFAAYLYSAQRLGEQRQFSVETKGGVVHIQISEPDDAGAWMVEVEMGSATFRSEAVGLSGPDRETVSELLEMTSGERLEVTAVSLGNPHCVVFQDDLEPEPLRRVAPRISTHPWFTRGANVQFARPIAPGIVEAWVWERGAGETLASGSSACAVAAAAVRRGLVSERMVEVRMPGGTLHVEVREDWSLVLRGPVEDVYEGEFTPGMLQRLRQVSVWP